jgi:hypothetical protein
VDMGFRKHSMHGTLINLLDRKKIKVRTDVWTISSNTEMISWGRTWKVIIFCFPKLVRGEKKEVISKSFLYFYSKSFFLGTFSTTRSHVLYQESWICFCMRLSPSTRSFSLALFLPGTLFFFLFTRRAEKL